MSIANPFRVENVNLIPATQGVYRLNFGKKYFIYKGLSIRNSVVGFAAQIDRELRHTKDGSILSNVIKHLKRYPVTYMTCTVLSQESDSTKMLIAEYEALKEAKADKNCLNISFENHSYFPKWIPQKSILDFKSILEGKGNKKANAKGVNLRSYLKKIGICEKKSLLIVEYVNKRWN